MNCETHTLRMLMIPERHYGQCDVCDNTTVLIARDKATAWFICGACVVPVVAAEGVMKASLQTSDK